MMEGTWMGEMMGCRCLGLGIELGRLIDNLGGGG